MEKKRTIGNVTAGFMVAVALLVDALQGLFTLTVFLIPLSWFLTFLSTIGFSLWFFLLGAYKGKGAEKRVLVSLAATAAEMVPLLNAIPAVTGGVALVIVQTRLKDLAEEKLGKIDPKKAVAAQRLARMREARMRRTETLRQEREEAEAGRHAPSNDDEPGEYRQAA